MYAVVKRLLDFTGAAMLLLFLWPVLLVVALVVRWKLGSPVLFVQVRPGLHERPFRLYKFRTMTTATDPNGEPLSDAKRMTAVGRFLRATSLDELPQLLNVLRGDLSFVGPRPLLMEYLPLYSARQRRRHDVRPGITGWAQVNGRNAQTWEERFELDLHYVEHRSIILDAKILLLTVVKVLAREGISGEGQATMAKFTGTEDSDNG